MVRDLCGISYEDWLTTHDTNDSEISDSGLLLARMRRHVTFTPDTVLRMLRKSTSTNLFGTIVFLIKNGNIHI